MNLPATPTERAKWSRTVLLSGVADRGTAHDGEVVDTLEAFLQQQVTCGQRVAQDVLAVELSTVAGARQAMLLRKQPSLPPVLSGIRMQWAPGYVDEGVFIPIAGPAAPKPSPSLQRTFDDDGFVEPLKLPPFPRIAWLEQREQERAEKLKRKREEDDLIAEQLRAKPPMPGFVQSGSVGPQGAVHAAPPQAVPAATQSVAVPGPAPAPAPQAEVLDVSEEYDRLLAKEREKKDKNRKAQEAIAQAAAAAAKAAARAAAAAALAAGDIEADGTGQNEKKRRRADSDDIPDTASTASAASAASTASAVQKRPKIADKEEALKEESAEELRRRERERQRQSEDLQKQNEELLAQLNRQKVEKAKKKEADRAKKDAAKKVKAEEKKARQTFLDFSKQVGEQKRKGRYRPSPFSRDIEKEYDSHFETDFPDRQDNILERIKKDFTYYREVVSALASFLRAQKGSDLRDPVPHLNFVASLLKLGGVYQTELVALLPTLLPQMLDQCTTKALTKACEHMRVVWRDLVAEDEWRVMFSLVSNLEVDAKERDAEAKRRKREKEKAAERERSTRERHPAVQEAFVQYAPPVAPTEPVAPYPSMHPSAMYGGGLPPQWVEQFDPTSNRPYFINTVTNETTWVDPRTMTSSL